MGWLTDRSEKWNLSNHTGQAGSLAAIINGTIIMGSLSGVKIALIMMNMDIVTDNGQRKAEIGSARMQKVRMRKRGMREWGRTREAEK